MDARETHDRYIIPDDVVREMAETKLPWWRRFGTLYIPEASGGPFLEIFLPLPQACGGTTQPSWVRERKSRAAA